MRPTEEPHPWDMPFVKGPFDGQKMKVPPPVRHQEVAMPYGDRVATYRPIMLRGTPVYEFVSYAPQSY